MKPYLHGLISVKKFGGKPEDYQKLHDWMDQTKAHVPDMRHRAILHNSFGIYLLEQVFGTNITNSDGKLISVRDIGEQHVLDDLGTIPTLQDYLTHLPALDWLGGPKRAKGVKADEAIKERAPKPEPGDGQWAKLLQEAADSQRKWNAARDQQSQLVRQDFIGKGIMGQYDPGLTVVD
jgi:hypothetical protein